MLAINGLTVNFGGRFLFDNVSFLINERDKIGLVGRNGTGKSTLLKIVAGIEEPSSGNITKPRYFTVGYLPQDIEVNSELCIYDEAYSALSEITDLENQLDDINDQLTTRTDYESDEYMELIELLSHHNERLRVLGSHTVQADIEQILIGLGFSREDFNRKMKEFSGGWQMRVELAKILLQKPNCILLDEPTNHLDIDSIRWLEVFLRNYPGAIVLVSHDRRFLDKITNRTIEITVSKVIDYPLKYSDYIEARIEQKEQEFSAFKNQQKQIAQTERFIERFKAKATFASRAQSRVKQLEKLERIELEDDDIDVMKIRFPEPPRSGRVVVETHGLFKNYGELSVLNNIDFALEREERVAFVGKNGEGKTTLSKIIAGNEEYEGTMQIGSNVVIGYYAQHQANLLNGDQNVFEVIDSAAVGEMRTRVRSLLGAFLFSGDSIYKKVKVLSGGEKSRLALAKLLLLPCNLLILDEPTNHLDMLSKDVLKSALLEYGGSLIVVSHDREFLEGLTNKTFEFKNHKIKEYLGDINYFLEKTNLETLQELELNKKNVVQKVEKASDSQVEREKRKETSRIISKITKQIEVLESEISDLELKISKIEDFFTSVEFSKHPNTSKNKNEELNSLKKSLDKKMSEWSKLEEELEQMKSE